MSKSSKEEALAEALRQARDATSQLSEAARKIWLAGLGAFAKANAGGGELFGKLMKQGAEFEATARKNAGERIKETRDTLEESVERASKQGKETWIKVEKAVSEQMKRSLDKLGVPGQDDLEAINSRLDQIAEGVRKAAAARAGGNPLAAKSNPPAPAKKAAAPAKKATAAPKKAAATKPAPAKKAAANSKPAAAKKAVAKAATPSAGKSATAKKKVAAATPPSTAKKSTAKAAAASAAISKAAALKKAGASIAAKRSLPKSSLPKPAPVARKRDEIADIAAELETAQLAARRATKAPSKKK